jgi:hypothetical protein
MSIFLSLYSFIYNIRYMLYSPKRDAKFIIVTIYARNNKKKERIHPIMGVFLYILLEKIFARIVRVKLYIILINIIYIFN